MPAYVKLPSGAILTRGDLPSPKLRLTAQRKAIIAQAVLFAICTREEIQQRYGMTAIELDRLTERYTTHGIAGLHVTNSRNRGTPA